MHFLGIVAGATKYFVSLSVNNQSPTDVTISYYQNGELKEQNIGKGSMNSIMVTITSNEQPRSMQFTAFEKGTNNAVKLNGNNTLVMTPSKVLETISVVLQGGKAYL